MLTIQNNTRLTLVHGDYRLVPDEIITVPDNVAKIWLLHDGVIEYKNPQEAKAEKAELEAQNAELLKEVEALRAEVKAAQEAKAEKATAPKKTSKK